jgi:hypothetical protein
MRSLRQRGSDLILHERVVTLKQQQRDADDRALKDGRLTAREINHKNAAFGSDFAKRPLDFNTIGRIR